MKTGYLVYTRSALGTLAWFSATPLTEKIFRVKTPTFKDLALQDLKISLLLLSGYYILDRMQYDYLIDFAF